MHEDIVAVEILPKKEWTCPSSLVTAASPAEHDSDDDNEESNSDKMVYMFTIF